MLAVDATASDLAGLDVVDRRGERLGRVRQIYPDAGRLAYVGVRGNLFGTEEVLIPLEGAEVEDDVLGVPVTRARFQVAPRRRPDAPLDDDERRDLRAFWSEPAVAPEPEPTPETASEVASESEPEPEEAGVMTASEERLRVDTERVPRTRVRLQKVVVTEQRTVTVPVRREEYRLIREPIVDGEPVPGGVIETDEQEIVLYEERVVVTTEVVPVERIRLVKEEVVDTREVTGEVRRERIDLVDAAAVDIAAVEPEVVHDEAEPIEAEVLEAPRELESARPQTARAMSTKRSTPSRSPRRPGSTPARSSTSAAAAAPPSTGAND